MFLCFLVPRWLLERLLRFVVVIARSRAFDSAQSAFSDKALLVPLALGMGVMKMISLSSLLCPVTVFRTLRLPGEVFQRHLFSAAGLFRVCAVHTRFRSAISSTVSKIPAQGGGLLIFRTEH